MIKAVSLRRMLWQTLFNHQKTMYLDQAKKAEIFGQYGKDTKDTGSVERDFGTARSLTKLVGRRRKLLKYLYNKDINRYRNLIKSLGLRK